MLIHADNFNIYGGDRLLMLNGRYSEANGVSSTSLTLEDDPDGVSTGKVLRMNGDATVRRPLKVPTSKVGIGMRLWLSGLPSDTAMEPIPMYWRDQNNVGLVHFYVTTTGAIVVAAYDSALGQNVTVGETPGPVITANGWWHLEAYFDASTLDFELRVEGISKITLDATDFGTSLDGRSTDVYQCGIVTSDNFIGASITSYFKDYFWWDGLGTLNNDFLGSCIVAELSPDADTALGSWAPSTGTTAWEILDTDTPGSDPYVSAAEPPSDPLVMSLSNLPADISSVKGVVTVVRAAKTDGGDGNLQVSMVSQSVEGNGEVRPITPAQTYWEDVFETDPNTDAAWVPTALDAAEIMLDRTV